MPLSEFDILLQSFDGYYQEYENIYSDYTVETYSSEVDLSFEQLKTPMGETINNVQRLLYCSHIYNPTLSEEQIRKALEAISKFEALHDKHREMKAINQQLTLRNDIEKIEETQEEVVNIKNNLFNIFSFMVGLLGFVFINFNVFKEIGEKPIEKIIVVVFLLNISFISGIIVSLNMFKVILYGNNDSNRETYGAKFIAGYILASILTLILYSLTPTIIEYGKSLLKPRKVYIEKQKFDYKLKLDKLESPE